MARGLRHLSTFWKAVRTFSEHSPFQLSAALSYYTLLSLAPIVLVTVAAASLIFGRTAVEAQIVAEVRNFTGEPAADLVQAILESADDPGKGVVSLVIGVATLLRGATTVFVQLQHAINEIWKVEADEQRSGLWSIVRKRLLSLGLVLAVGFLLLVSLLLSAGLSALGAWAARTSGVGETVPLLLQAGDVVVSLVVVGALLALIFRYLPDVELGWRDVAFGALFTAILFTIGKFLIGVYLGRASVGSAYGAAGSTVVFMVWVYYAAIILLFGAKLTQVRTEAVRGPAQPEAHAVPVEGQDERAPHPPSVH
jgi:membrane protein